MLSGPLSANAARSSRILIVDDDPNLLVLLAEQLREDGFEIATARDGQEALRRLESGWPDLLIVDMMMPRMDGLTLAREIKGRADLPIIVLSAIDAGDSKADCSKRSRRTTSPSPITTPSCGRGSTASCAALVTAFRARASSWGRT